MTTLVEYLEIAADNCVASGDVDIAVLMRQAASTIIRQQAQLAESRELEGRMREALTGMLEIHGVTQRYADTHIEIPQSWVDSSEIARKALAANQEKNDE